MDKSLQEYCNELVDALEKAVKAAVFAKRIRTNNQNEIKIAKQATNAAKK